MVKVIQSLYPVTVILIAATCAAFNVLTHPRAVARPTPQPQNISVYAPTIVVVQTPGQNREPLLATMPAPPPSLQHHEFEHDEFDAHPLK